MAVFSVESRRRRQAGFTFIEIMVSMMILLILIGAAGFTYVRYISRARVVSAKNQIEAFVVSMNSYFIDNDVYPTQDQGLGALWEKPALAPAPNNWNGPYLSKPVPKDPWGHDFQYLSPGPNGLAYGIRSFGADGTEGGTGNNADINSWES